MTSLSAAFYSYVHADDEADFGLIAKLADQLKRQFKVHTTEDLELFIDHDLRWGDAWRDRVQGAVGGTTFFYSRDYPELLCKHRVSERTAPICRPRGAEWSSQASDADLLGGRRGTRDWG